MTHPDDELRKRYRGLSTEEPPRALDEAILASARRAVAPRSATQRWAMPVSIAAVLMLAVGVTLRMQQEKPGIESSVSSAEYPMPPSEPAEASKDAAAPASAPAPAPAPAPVPQAPAQAKALPQKKAKLDDIARQRPEPVEERFQARAPSEPKAFAEAPPPPVAQATAPATSAPATVAPAPAAPAAKAERSNTFRAEDRRDASADASLEAQRSKRAAAPAAAGLAKEATADPLEKELQRIAQLRRNGRHAEADEALRIFRRDHPDYRIADALWEQVKPR